MRKYLYLLLIPLLFVSCSKTKTVKETAQNYMQSMLKNPESFQVEYIDASVDTIPFFLDSNILKAAKETYDAMEQYNRYKDRGYLWADEKSEASTKFIASKLVLETLCKEDNKEEPQTQYVVLMKSSGTNPMGGRVSSKEIIIVDKTDPKKVLGFFNIDKDFIGEFMMAMYSRNPNWEIKENQFGKYETEGMSRIEKFIIED